MKSFKPFCFVLGLAIILASAAPLAAQERILSFDSRIQIATDGSMLVTENIRVAAEGKQIRRGIYRDFPTRYKDDHGGVIQVRCDIVEVRRDGRPDAFHTESLSNGIRIYMGNKNVYLNPGQYTYTLVYRTDRQIGFFKDYDELYWNVTGNGWVFPMDRIQAEIELPPGGNVLQYAAYTGRQGEKGKDYSAQARDNGFAFATTRPLSSNEGLTIAVAWPKGIVQEPDMHKKMGYLMADYGGQLLALAGLLLLLAYYLVVWRMVGRDPEKGVIIPLYTPPEDFSPAAIRFIRQMGFDTKALAVALVDMAVKGFLDISESRAGTYSLSIQSDNRESLSRGERAVAKHLFPGNKSSITLSNKEHKKVQAAITALRTSLSGEYEKGYFLRNTRYFVAGLLISLVGMAGIFLATSAAPVALFLILWLSLWSIGVYALGRSVIDAWRSRKSASAIGIILFALPFFAGEIVALGILVFTIPFTALVLLVAIVATDILFYHWLKAPTLAGRRLLDEIDGLKQYMEVAEKDRLDLLNPPDRTPEHFAALLPYAMALDVENAWNAQFADVLARISADPEARRHSPMGWYHGHTAITGLATSLGSAFSGAVSSSSSAPGSSSGSGGGGSSGGGGGGGGGGGW